MNIKKIKDSFKRAVKDSRDPITGDEKEVITDEEIQRLVEAAAKGKGIYDYAWSSDVYAGKIKYMSDWDRKDTMERNPDWKGAKYFITSETTEPAEVFDNEEDFRSELEFLLTNMDMGDFTTE